MTKALTINGTDYTVTRLPEAEYSIPVFTLTSSRTQYTAMVTSDEMGAGYVWVTNARGKGPKAFIGVILGYTGGTLRVVRQ